MSAGGYICTAVLDNVRCKFDVKKNRAILYFHKNNTQEKIRLFQELKIILQTAVKKA